MKLNVILLLTGLLISCMACDNNDVIENTDEQEIFETTLKFDADASIDEDMVSFNINSAGLYNDNLYLSLSYTGGEKAHEFSLSSDGEYTEDAEGKKIVQINVLHMTYDDAGTDLIEDSLVISLDDINISDELKEDVDLWYNLVNASNTDNSFLIAINQEEDDDDDDHDVTMPQYTLTLQVINSECNEIGAWTNNWLISDNNDSTFYFIPVELDETIDYTPNTNDNLLVTYEYSAIYDIDNNTCDFVSTEQVYAIKINALELVNE